MPTMAEKAGMLFDGESFGLDPRISHPTPFAHCITVCRSRKHAQEVHISSLLRSWVAKTSASQRSLRHQGLTPGHLTVAPGQQGRARAAPHVGTRDSTGLAAPPG